MLGGVSGEAFIVLLRDPPATALSIRGVCGLSKCTSRVYTEDIEYNSDMKIALSYNTPGKQVTYSSVALSSRSS